jgi:3-dehydroquinate synthase
MTQRVIKVRTKPSYEIIIKPGLLSEIPEDLKANFSFGKVAIITDSNVEKLYGRSLLNLLQSSGISAKLFSFPAGEQSKNMDTVVLLSRHLIRSNFDRHDLILALGGGVVGDVAGFLASIYLRGIPFVQVPTSLLAQVDSSIGGKTGVDLPEGKNLLGTFYQPARVYIDPEVLKTLPESNLRDGLAEVIKYACTLKPKLFSFLEKNHHAVLSLKDKALLRIIYDSCQAKAQVVSKDEKESGLRRVLNFGHTLGHALEAYADYKLQHGFCVAVGMVFACRLSERLRLAQTGLTERVERLLKLYQLPTRISELGLKVDRADVPKILSYFGRDKKVWKGKLTLVLLKNLGDFVFYEVSETKTLESVLEELL